MDDGHQGPKPSEVDSQYQPFEPFESWANVPVDQAAWQVRHDELLQLAGNDAGLLAKARDAVKRAAAFETGAIEGLYELDRGVTISAAVSSAMVEAFLQKQDKAKSLIEAQLRGYDFVLDFATGKEPLAEAWIRELHKVLCEEQATYTVSTAAGLQQHKLRHGQYKEHPNHVLKADATYHAYAPVEQTAPEMHRLMEQVRSEAFTSAPAALRAAYVHHAFTAIHPFADGNGRVARALASIYTYQVARVPLLIVSDDRERYFDALEAADRKRFAPFVGFITEAGRAALDLVLQSLRAARGPSLEESVKSLLKVNRTSGGYLHVDVDAAAVTLSQEVVKALNAALTVGLGIGEIDYKVELRRGGPAASPQAGYRTPKTVDTVQIIVTAGTRPPADASASVVLDALVPLDCGANDFILMTTPTQDPVLEILMRDLFPRVTLAAEIRIRIWAESVWALALANLQTEATRRLKKRGLAASE